MVFTTVAAVSKVAYPRRHPSRPFFEAVGSSLKTWYADSAFSATIAYLNLKDTKDILAEHYSMDKQSAVHTKESSRIIRSLKTLVPAVFLHAAHTSP